VAEVELVTHLFQVAAKVAMERPKTLGARVLQSAREEVISCFRVLDPADVVLGQFDGYRDVPGVTADSRRDTYVAARLWVDNDRWRGVPFHLGIGKRLAVSPQRVSLILREPSEPRSGRLPREANVVALSLAGRRDRPVTGRKETWTDPRSRRGPRVDCPRRSGGRRSATALRPPHPRRPPGRPLAVHPTGRVGGGVGDGAAAALGPGTGLVLPARLVGARPGACAGRPRPLAPWPVGRTLPLSVRGLGCRGPSRRRRARCGPRSHPSCPTRR